MNKFIKFRVCTFLFFLTIGMISTSCIGKKTKIIPIVTPQLSDSTLVIKAVYVHPAPYKEILITNSRIGVKFIHKSKPSITRGSGKKGGYRHLNLSENSLGYPIDSFKLEITCGSILPDLHIFSPEKPYVIENIKAYRGDTLTLPYYLKYPCCLDKNLNLKPQWTKQPHKNGPGKCPCIDK